MTTRPGHTEAAEYYFTYIDRVPDGDICARLETQGREVLALLHAVPDGRSRHRYAPDKWSLRELLGHLSDTERLCAARAFWFARGFDTPLPSFDQHVAVAAAGADERPWPDLLAEFAELRRVTVTFFRSLPAPAWDRRGVASGKSVTVRALAWVAAGHVTHHIDIVQARYLER